jgi:hypothetical protein
MTIYKDRLNNLSRVIACHPQQASQPHNVPQCAAAATLTIGWHQTWDLRFRKAVLEDPTGGLAPARLRAEIGGRHRKRKVR